MPQPSQLLAERYALRLSSSWRDWFDRDAQQLVLPGAMRHALSAEELVQEAPTQIWPGFMLPDTLPLVGNDYGDWICVRVDAQGELGELLYWYHGGGDWIPVGTNLAEAIAHDVVDQFRDVRAQMLRGASESRVDRHFSFIQRFSDKRLRSWMIDQLAGEAPAEPIKHDLQALAEMLVREDYPAALELLREREWAMDAVACDWAELLLQSPVQRIAHKELAAKAGLVWYPHYVNLLFDVTRFSSEARSQLEAAVPTGLDWPTQNWSAAAQVAASVVARRSDMGWAHTLLGWQHERNGDLEAAQQVYWHGRLASSFSDQAVRFNCHAMIEELGKFGMTRLVEHAAQGSLPEPYRQDAYFRHFLGPRDRSLLSEVYAYWRAHAQQCSAAGDEAGSYHALTRAGWDLGVSRLSEYEQLLKDLATAARSAGWEARARVAHTHYRCLKQRVA